MLHVSLVGPAGTHVAHALLDTGSDDSVFPEDIATRIGIDLSSAPTGTGRGVGASPSASLRYAEVTLRIATATEQREWSGWVGFTAGPLRRPLLGYAGFLQFFDITFRGAREEVELAINAAYPGT
jgi:hypothetical protein